MTALLQRKIMPNGSLCLIRTDTLTLLKMHSVDLYCKMSSPGKSGSKLPLQKLISRKMKGQISFSKSVFKNFIVKAVQGGQPPIEGGEPPRRLVDFIRAFPDISRNYFKSPFRRALFGGISLLGGFYVAQTISLSFGALGVNDVIAAVLCVILTEYVTRFYYTRSKVTFAVALLNNFKMGFTYGLFIDAFKLAS